ncbi:cytochrome P450 [Pseudoduganella eburnea]|uniref:Cytochrome P450 n=1 Tax=Massilia eburnea TaxID=1776165 RepID=A0A6L6QGD5_9BURK|nr:cytochrome P450 [Massilia eburnea]MTW11295.1 cytochrome P450 [Massilia eburnea]
MEHLPGPSGLPLVGNIGLDAAHFHQTLEQWAREHGPIYRFRMMDRRFIVNSRRADIAQILHDRPDQWRRTSRIAGILEEASARGVFSAEGEEWRRQRKMVMRALTPEVINRFHPTLEAMTERLRRRWLAAAEAGQPQRLLRDLKAFALDVAIGMAMGQDQDMLENEDNPLQQDIEFVFGQVARRVVAPVTYWRTIKLPVDRATDAAGLRIRLAVDGFIADARARMAANPALYDKPSNLLEAMLAARDMPDSGISDQVVQANAITMVFAGEDTTANTIAWLLHLLSQHPQAAARLAQEADCAANLEEMPYLEACVQEAMRLKPVAPLMGAEAVRDVALDGVQVPAGVVVFLLLRHSFALETPLDDGAEFRPERWLDPAMKQVLEDPARKMVPFGGGPRFCPGRYLAMSEIRMVMSMLMRSFTIHAIPGAAAVEEMFTFTMTPSALPLLLRPRQL